MIISKELYGKEKHPNNNAVEVTKQ